MVDVLQQFTVAAPVFMRARFGALQNPKCQSSGCYRGYEKFGNRDSLNLILSPKMTFVFGRYFQYQINQRGSLLICSIKPGKYRSNHSSNFSFNVGFLISSDP